MKRPDFDAILASIPEPKPHPDDHQWESFNVCSCNKEGTCIVCHVWLDEKFLDLTDRWHNAEGAPDGKAVGLPEFLGLTREQFGRWLRDSQDLDADVRKRLCWGS